MNYSIMESGATAPHSKTWPQFPRSIGACVLECAGAPALLRGYDDPETRHVAEIDPTPLNSRGTVWIPQMRLSSSIV